MSTEQLTKAYTIERLNPTNLSDVEKLHAAVYGRKSQDGFFLKKYDTAFTGVNHIGYVVYNTDRVPIGYYGVIPCFIQIDGQIILAAQSADTMTHPLHRFKGLFVELSNLTFQLCRDNGIKLLFGFPNQNSLPGAINKLGWQMTERMDYFMIPSGGVAWDKVINKLSFLKNTFTNYQQRVLKKYLQPQPGIINSVIQDGFAGIVRDGDYWQYKTYAQSYIIKLGNSTLWVKIGRELLIGDILTQPEDFDKMLLLLKKFARKLGISQIQFHTSGLTTLHKLFSERFIPTPSFPVLFQDFEGGLPVERIKFTSADIDTF
jgi:hypothetical protein